MCCVRSWIWYTLRLLNYRRAYLINIPTNKSCKTLYMVSDSSLTAAHHIEGDYWDWNILIGLSCLLVCYKPFSRSLFYALVYNITPIYFFLRGNCTTNQNWACFMRYLKIINTLFDKQCEQLYISTLNGSRVID